MPRSLVTCGQQSIQIQGLNNSVSFPVPSDPKYSKWFILYHNFLTDTNKNKIKRNFKKTMLSATHSKEYGKSYTVLWNSDMPNNFSEISVSQLRNLSNKWQKDQTGTYQKLCILLAVLPLSQNRLGFSHVSCTSQL